MCLLNGARAPEAAKEAQGSIQHSVESGIEASRRPICQRRVESQYLASRHRVWYRVSIESMRRVSVESSVEPSVESASSLASSLASSSSRPGLRLGSASDPVTRAETAKNVCFTRAPKCPHVGHLGMARENRASMRCGRAALDRFGNHTRQ